MHQIWIFEKTKQKKNACLDIRWLSAGSIFDKKKTVAAAVGAFCVCASSRANCRRALVVVRQLACRQHAAARLLTSSSKDYILKLWR